MKKFLLSLFLLIVMLVLYFGLTNYHEDIPMKTLKEKYEYEDSKYLSLDGMQVHYRDIGSGQPLVLIHGTAASLHDWERWIPFLKDDFRIIALDLPAFGLTGVHPKGDYRMDTYVKFFDDFTKAMNLENFYLAGNSFGARIAWNHALEYPGKAEKMVLLNSSGYPSEKPTMLGFRLLQNPIVQKAFTSISPKALITKSVYDVYEDDSKVTKADEDKYFDMLLGSGKRKALMEKMKIPLGEDYKKMAAIDIPTLVIWGDKDEVVDPAGAPKFHADLPNSELIIYKNVGHCPMLEIPERSAKDVLKFLKTVAIPTDGVPQVPELFSKQES